MKILARMTVKRRTHMACLMAGCGLMAIAATGVSAHAAIIQIDLSDSGSVSPDSTWNELTTVGDYSGLKDTTGAVTSVGLDYDQGNAFGVAEKAVSLTGYAFDGDPIWDPVVNDGWEMKRDDPPTYIQYFTVTLTGLNNAINYKIEIASTSNGGFSNDISIDGSYGDSTPNGDNFSPKVDGRNNGNIIVWNSVAPASGKIVVTIAETQAYGGQSEISALRLIEIPEPATLSLLALGTTLIIWKKSRRYGNR